MVVLSMEQAVAVLIVCAFILGVVVDRAWIWFYNNYVNNEEDDQFVEDSDCIVS